MSLFLVCIFLCASLSLFLISQHLCHVIGFPCQCLVVCLLVCLSLSLSLSRSVYLLVYHSFGLSPLGMLISWSVYHLVCFILGLFISWSVYFLVCSSFDLF